MRDDYYDEDYVKESHLLSTPMFNLLMCATRAGYIDLLHENQEGVAEIMADSPLKWNMFHCAFLFNRPECIEALLAYTSAHSIRKIRSSAFPPQCLRPELAEHFPCFQYGGFVPIQKQVERYADMDVWKDEIIYNRYGRTMAQRASGFIVGLQRFKLEIAKFVWPTALYEPDFIRAFHGAPVWGFIRILFEWRYVREPFFGLFMISYRRSSRMRSLVEVAKHVLDTDSKWFEK